MISLKITKRRGLSKQISSFKKLLDIQMNYKTNGIDILSAPTKEVYKRKDYFYKEELLKLGKVWYERN